ncbi:MAG: cation:proton antiporter, partial [Candidatus Thiodiazotropha taylori]|nr:cation:proton antiporter [Candidatus Thiodiazotropha taylori]
LGYLLAGIFIGPVIGLVGSETQTIQHFAEFGVVMMLFLVGLELQPRMLWEMRNRLIGLGGLQVALTTALITAAALMMGLYWSVALTVGLIFSLSSTAIVLQTLNEKGLSKTEGGRAGFSVLLFQDIAVIPMLALIPLLALPELVGGGGATLAAAADSHGDAGHHHGMSLVAGLPGWAHALVVLGAIASVLLGGHFLSRPMFRFIAESRLREIFTASALMLVIGIALLMTLVDLSPALGTFLAGVVLANSEFRHELESDIEPFKGLLLGLFFITVGAGIDFNILFNDALTILSLTVGVIVIKGLVLYGLARAFRLTTTDGWLLTLGLAQAGEFGFVLLSFSLQNQVLPAELASTLSLVVALSMLLTPVLFILYDKLILNRQPESDQRQADNIDETGSVIIAGNGRFGQIVNRLLVASGVQTTVLDHQADIINMLSKVGVKSYYGDASRPELLHAAGIESAKAVVIAIDDRSRTLEMVEHIRRHYPEVKILARAFDVNHLYLLNKAGVDIAVRELFDSSLELGKATLKAVGVHPFKVEKMSTAFRKHDENGMNTLYELWDENTEMASNKAYLARARELGETLKEMMETDRMQLHDRSERGWTPPPKHYTKDMGE